VEWNENIRKKNKCKTEVRIVPVIRRGCRGRGRGRDRMIAGFATTYAISAYYH
jgi:hypothetical protein